MLRERWAHVTLSETLPLRFAQRKLTRAFRLPQLWFRWPPPPPFISLCLFLSSSPMSLCNTTINHMPPTKDIWNPSTLWALRLTLGELLSVHRHEHVTQGSGTHTNTHKQNTVDPKWNPKRPHSIPDKTSARLFFHTIIIPHAKMQMGLSFVRTCFLINTTISWPSVKYVWLLVCVAPPTSFIHTARCAQSGDDEIFNTNRPRAAYSDINISYPK